MTNLSIMVTAIFLSDDYKDSPCLFYIICYAAVLTILVFVMNQFFTQLTYLFLKFQNDY